MKSLSAALSLIALATISFSTQAQDTKIGYVDQQFIFQNLPEFKALNKEIETKSLQYDKILKSKYDEFESKSVVFQKLLEAKSSEAILRDKATELENLKKSYEEFQTNSLAELRDYYGKKFIPIKQKVSEAIVFAGKKRDYDFVLRMDLNPDGGDIWPVVLYARDSTANLTSEILKNLGVNEAAASGKKIGLPQTIQQK